MSALLDMLGRMDENAAPWLPPEIELLSARIEGKSRKKFFARLWNGTLQTVYGEPLIAFAARIFTEKQYISVWKTTSTHYGLISTGRQVQVFVNNKACGMIVDGELIGYQFGTGRIRSTVGGMQAIQIDTSDLAIFRSRGDRSNVTDRFFEMLADNDITEKNLHAFSLLLFYARMQALISKGK